MYLRDAFHVAKCSLDPSTQVGSVLVHANGGGIILGEYNAVPYRLRGAGYPVVESDKNYCTEHAERRTIFKALRNGTATEGLTLYCTWASCSECARTLIDFGINRVVTFSALIERTPIRWKDSVYHGLKMMRDCGISVVGWRGDLGINDYILFDRQNIGNEDLK